MSINSTFYIHEADKAALKALKSIPGFTPLVKAFLKIWNEQQYRIENMSSNLRISEKQLPKYYHMLPPICRQLGIEVPELYLKLDVVPNAYTSGDTKPFIVITSGLLETLPERLIPTVLAHECGHIACHHVLYRTMGQMICSGAVSFLGLGELVTLPVQSAFAYWMRCSEYSADRAAAICSQSAESIVEMCMCFAGFGKNIDGQVNVEAFLEQALEYKEMMKDSKWNKTLEFLMFNATSHPLNSVRAYECNEWCKTENFINICKYQQKEAAGDDTGELLKKISELPMPYSSKAYIGKNYVTVEMQLRDLGFENIVLTVQTEKSLLFRNGQVLKILINGQNGFSEGSWFPVDSKVEIVYFQAESEDPYAKYQGIKNMLDENLRKLRF